MPMNVPTPSLGRGQTYTDVTASRAGSTTYTNTTGKPLAVLIQANAGASSGQFNVSINGGGAVPFARCDLPSGTANLCGGFVVPVGATYNVSASPGGFNLVKWWELR